MTDKTHKMCTLYAGRIYKFDYVNYQGRSESRRVRMESLSYGTNDFHSKEPQWLLNGHCLTRNARRTFALADIIKGTLEAEAMPADWPAVWEKFDDAKRSTP